MIAQLCWLGWEFPSRLLSVVYPWEATSLWLSPDGILIFWLGCCSFQPAPLPNSPDARVNRDKSIALAQDEGVEAVSGAMLSKLLAPQTYTANPELVAQVQEIMTHMSLAGMVGSLTGMRDRPDAHPDLAKISVPVLVIHGRDDQIIPVAEAEQMAATSPQVKLAVIQNAGHLLNMEQPAAFNLAVMDWISFVRSAPGG